MLGDGALQMLGDGALQMLGDGTLQMLGDGALQKLGTRESTLLKIDRPGWTEEYVIGALAEQDCTDGAEKDGAEALDTNVTGRTSLLSREVSKDLAALNVGLLLYTTGPEKTKITNVRI